MGKIRQGILGGFRGTVGTVVGSYWKGTACMRGKATGHKDAKTQRQLEQRTKFRLAGDFVKKHMDLLQRTFRPGGKQTPYNAAMAYYLKYALTFYQGEWYLDQQKLRISQGNLLLPPNIHKYNNGQCKVDFLWDDNSGVGNAKADDRAVIFIYDTTPDEPVSVYEITNATRADGCASIQLDRNQFQVHICHLYLGFLSADGRLASNSQYVDIDTMQPWADDEP